MARDPELRALVDRFASQLEEAVTSRVAAEFARRFEELRASVLAGATKAPATRGRRQPGPPPGTRAQPKPCPVCGEPNKARRFSYLCEAHRSAESLAKFKGGQPPAVKRRPAEGRGRKPTRARG